MYLIYDEEIIVFYDVNHWVSGLFRPLFHETCDCDIFSEIKFVFGYR